MFGSIVRLAQAEVENSIGHIVDKIIVVVPFLIALGFGAAAVSIRVVELYGAVSGLLLMAAAFVILGALIAVFTSYRRSRRPATLKSVAHGSAAPVSDENPTAETDSPQAMAADRELLISALTAAAPIALPQLLRLILKNLPLLAAICAAVFVLTRPTPAAEGADYAEDENVVPAE